MKVISTENPQTNLISKSLDKVDFEDTYATTNQVDDLERITHLIFGKSPKWVMYLMRFRNFLVRFIGLKVVVPDDVNKRWEPGGYIAFFKIYVIAENEVILGADDSHLKFRVSVLNDQSNQHNIKVTTLVEYMNRTGKVYMFFVKPFHKLVVKRMVKQAYLQ